MQQFKNDIITEFHYNSLVASDTNLQNQITTLSDLAGGGASNLLTTSKTLIGAINEIHDGYLPLTGGSMTGALTILGNASDHLFKTRGIWGINPDGTDGDLYIGYNNGTAHSYATRFGYGGEGSISADGTYYSGTSNLANGVKDYNNGNTVTFGYSTSGMSSTSWLGSWDGYKLRAIAPNVLDVRGASQLNSIRTIGGNTFAAALQSNFNSYKASTTRNVLLHYYSSAYGNGSAVFGYYLNGYDSNPYGGFYVCHYNSAKYVGIQNGTYTQYEITKSASSSRKVKENISLMTDEQANNLLNLSVINFDYKPDIENGKKNQKGIIIEELIDTMPECIVNLDDYNGDNSEILQVDYTKFVPYLIKMVQIQQKQIDSLKKER